jgi:hypothetical protein
MKISIHFHNQPIIEVQVNDTPTGRKYFDISRRQNEQQQPFYRDTSIYTYEYMIELAHRARDAFGWSWVADTYDQAQLAELHKDLENSVGRLGFESIPEEYDSLVYDLHHCLHAQPHDPTSPAAKLLRRDNLQIEWFTDNSCPLPEDFEFTETSNYGDLILINPYVGHNPLQIYRENDFNSLATTCRFHDIIKPGIVITPKPNITVTKETILKKFQDNDPAFVEQHGKDKIKYYAGAATIGRVVDIDVLSYVRETPELLTLDRVEFHG